MPNGNLVDIVYLWVDGGDPQWRSRRRSAKSRLANSGGKDLAAYGDVEGRFRDNDELRYSLRALTQYFPDHGHIYLVTDRQTPRWLRSHPRLSIVDHRALIPAGSLPTYDSGHIESYIHRIANLSERYFYFNDDVFLGAPLDLTQWFFEGGVFVGWSNDPEVSDEPMQTDATALENACRRSIAWLREKAAAAGESPYSGVFRTFSHAPRPMLKSVMVALEDIAPELFTSVRSTVFRSWAHPTLVSDFVLRWSLLHGFAKVKDYRFVHVSTGAANSQVLLQDIALRLGAADFFCINDTLDDALADDPRLGSVRRALGQMFTMPSPFELADDCPLDATTQLDLELEPQFEMAT